MLIRSVANLGFRGQLRSIYIRDQNPGYVSKATLMNIYKVGVDLGLRIVSDVITVFDEVKLESLGSSLQKDMDHEELLHMRQVFDEIVRDDRLADDTILTNSYKKVIYL